MKKHFIFLAILIIPSIMWGQIDQTINKKLDSVRVLSKKYTDSVKKTINVSGGTNTYTDSVVKNLTSKLVPLTIKKYTSNLPGAGFFSLDTLITPINTVWFVDIMVEGKQQVGLKACHTHREMTITNVNGTYTVIDNQIASMNGTFNSAYTYAITKNGVEIWITPGAGLVDWTETYSTRQL